jgi:hypothetical protein
VVAVAVFTPVAEHRALEVLVGAEMQGRHSQVTVLLQHPILVLVGAVLPTTVVMIQYLVVLVDRV